ncbi:MAG: class I SAM-dependent methyltransferase [candidate division KSB1 bacterium]|nr:class I SAM-dependent methyltransferase [candidate division KSB1 bacterium]
MEKSEYDNIFQKEDNYWWYKALHELVLYFVKAYSRSSVRILDAGCGTGRLMQLMSDYGTVEGMDISDEAVRLARSRGLPNVQQKDLHEWDPSPESFDIITSMDVLYTLEDDELVLNKFYIALKKRGLLLLNVAAFNFLRRAHDNIVHTKRRYTAKSIRSKLEKSGFAVQRVTYRLPFLFLALCLIKAYETLFKPKNISSDLKPLSPWINRILLGVNRLENTLIKKGFNLPIGSSIFVIAQKK